MNHLTFNAMDDDIELGNEVCNIIDQINNGIRDCSCPYCGMAIEAVMVRSILHSYLSAECSYCGFKISGHIRREHLLATRRR